MDALTYVVMKRLFTGIKKAPIYETVPLSFWDPKTIDVISVKELKDVDVAQTGEIITEYELPIGKLALLEIMSPFYL